MNSNAWSTTRTLGLVPTDSVTPPFPGGGLRPTVGAQMGESVELVGGARNDVHRDPTKPAVHKNTKHAGRDAAPTCEYSRQNQVVRCGPPAVWSAWAPSP